MIYKAHQQSYKHGLSQTHLLTWGSTDICAYTYMELKVLKSPTVAEYIETVRLRFSSYLKPSNLSSIMSAASLQVSKKVPVIPPL